MESKKIAIISACSIVILVALITFSYWVYYIEDNVTSGDYIGFSIGDSKENTYSKLRNSYKNKTVYFFHEDLINKNRQPRVPIHFSQDDFNLVNEYDNWSFSFDKKSLNSIRFLFQDGELTKISRKRILFELP